MAPDYRFDSQFDKNVDISGPNKLNFATFMTPVSTATFQQNLTVGVDYAGLPAFLSNFIDDFMFFFSKNFMLFPDFFLKFLGKLKS